MRMYPAEDFEDLSASLITLTNRSVYYDSNYTTVPKCIYFYYVTFTKLDEPEVKVYFYDHRAAILPTELDDIIEGLALNARLNDNLPPSCGSIFEAVTWRRRSYLVMVIDDDDKKLKEGSAIIIDSSAGAANYTFLDGQDIPINVRKLGGGFDTLFALVCINHMKKDSAGNDLGSGEYQHFVYKLVFESARSPGVFTTEIDPGGTNLGPPPVGG